MESVPLDMDDILGEEVDEEFNVSRLPDLEDELEPMRDLERDTQDRNNGSDNENPAAQISDDPDLLAKLKSMKGASKNGTKRSMPKLDVERLTGDRGIPILPKLFEKVTVHLKGKGHEAADLKLVMRHMEHWGHRLFPKMPFAEVVERAERLGNKKAVQTCVKRIRLDMPVLPEDHVGDGDNVQRVGDNQDENDDEEERNRRSPSPFPEIDEDEIEGLIRDQEEAVESFTSQNDNKTNQSSTTEPSKVSDLESDVKARIERNKQLALERRAAKLAAAKNESSKNPAVSANSSVTADLGDGLENTDPVMSTEIKNNQDKTKQAQTDLVEHAVEADNSAVDVGEENDKSNWSSLSEVGDCPGENHSVEGANDVGEELLPSDKGCGVPDENNSSQGKVNSAEEIIEENSCITDPNPS